MPRHRYSARSTASHLKSSASQSPTRDLLAWAVAHNLNPGEKDHHRRDAASEEILSRTSPSRRSAVIGFDIVLRCR